VARYAMIDKAQPDMRLTRVAVASMPWSGAAPREVVRLYHLRYFATAPRQRLRSSRQVATEQVGKPQLH
jgi:hypothetical protein